ncbi:MAG: SBBP repeat-containing protein [Bacteroidia bacterium]
MKKIYLLVAAIIFSVNVNAQTPAWLWAKGMGGGGSDGGNSLITDANGNIYTTGTFVDIVDFDPGAGVFNLTSANGSFDVFVSKTDSGGNFVWAKAIGGIDTDNGRSIAFDPSGSGAVYISGHFRGTTDFDPGAGVFNLTSATPGYSDIFICKLDTSGNFIWAKTMGGAEDDAGYSITIDPAGTGAVYCMGYFRATVDFDPGAGVFNLTSAGNTDIFVSKYSSSGNLIWVKAMRGTGYDWGIFIARCPAGSTDVYTTGYFSGTVDFDPGTGTYNMTSAGSDDIFISKLDSAGNFIWAKALGGTDGDYATSIASDISGNVYTTGNFKLTADFDPGAGTYNLISTSGSNDIFISKLDSSGNFVWAKKIGGSTYDTGNDIIVDPFGNIYTIGGFTGMVDFDPGVGVAVFTSGGNIDIFISRMDSSGNFVWAQHAVGANADNGRSFAFDAAGYLYATGSFSSTTLIFTSATSLTNAGQSDIFIAKLDAVFPTGIETISNFQFSISIFPNPFSEELIISSSEFGDKAEIKIYDMFGRIIYSQKLLTANCKLQTGRTEFIS